jgi:hypothetical protein
MKRKGLDAMAAFAKLLVLIAIFLSASNANAFTSLSPVAGNQVQENHWFWFVEPMSKRTNKQTGELTKKSWVPYREPKQDAELPSKLTDLTNTQTGGLCHDKESEPESFVDKPGIEQEINHPITPANEYSQIWQMPSTINLNSSGLSHATTMTNQNAHLRSASPQSFSSVRVPFSTIRSNLSSGLNNWVKSLAVKVQVSSTLKVSCHVFTLLPFEPVTSTTKISSAETALKATAEMQLSADSNNINNASSFDDKPSSTFQLVVASVDRISKAISNKPFKTLRLKRIKSKMQPTFKLIFWIQTTVSEPIAARFGQPLIVEYLFNCQAQLLQHQSKSKLSQVNCCISLF